MIVSEVRVESGKCWAEFSLEWNNRFYVGRSTVKFSVGFLSNYRTGSTHLIFCITVMNFSCFLCVD